METNIRANMIKEVEKFRKCGDIKNGFKLLVCEGCHDMRFVEAIMITREKCAWSKAYCE